MCIYNINISDKKYYKLIDGSVEYSVYYSILSLSYFVLDSEVVEEVDRFLLAHNFIAAFVSLMEEGFECIDFSLGRLVSERAKVCSYDCDEFLFSQITITIMIECIPNFFGSMRSNYYLGGQFHASKGLNFFIILKRDGLCRWEEKGSSNNYFGKHLNFLFILFNLNLYSFHFLK